MSYTRDGTDRITSRAEGSATIRYGYSGPGDSASVVLDASSHVLQRTVPLSVATVAKQPSGEVWSYPSVHGDVVATAGALGLQQGPALSYDPLRPGCPARRLPGQPRLRLARPVPAPRRPGLDDRDGGEALRPRPRRFLSVDPVPGGSANDNDYCSGDPVNCRRPATGPRSSGGSSTDRSLRPRGRRRPRRPRQTPRLTRRRRSAVARAPPRFHLYFTPAYSSWRNLIERWFAEPATKWIKRGAHRSVKELTASIRTWITNWNDDPRPYVWHKTADEILDSLAAYCRGSTTQVTRGMGERRLRGCHAVPVGAYAERHRSPAPSHGIGHSRFRLGRGRGRGRGHGPGPEDPDDLAEATSELTAMLCRPG